MKKLQAEALGAGLDGDYRVRLFRPALEEAKRLIGPRKDMMELRSHALKLRFWPRNPNPAEPILDLDWDWIRALKGLDIGELRIDDTIGGHDNLRIIFFKGDPKICAPLPLIWVIAVRQKKRMEWTTHALSTFRGRRLLVCERFYKNHEFT